MAEQGEIRLNEISRYGPVRDIENKRKHQLMHVSISFASYKMVRNAKLMTRHVIITQTQSEANYAALRDTRICL